MGNRRKACFWKNGKNFDRIFWIKNSKQRKRCTEETVSGATKKDPPLPLHVNCLHEIESPVCFVINNVTCCGQSCFFSIYLHSGFLCPLSVMRDFESSDSFDYLFKIVLIGDPGVGKTCLVQRFDKGTYMERHGSTIGVDFTMKTIAIDEKKIKVS